MDATFPKKDTRGSIVKSKRRNRFRTRDTIVEIFRKKNFLRRFRKIYVSSVNIISREEGVVPPLSRFHELAEVLAVVVVSAGYLGAMTRLKTRRIFARGKYTYANTVTSDNFRGSVRSLCCGEGSRLLNSRRTNETIATIAKEFSFAESLHLPYFPLPLPR